MAGIFKISDAALLGLHAAAYMAQHEGVLVTTREVAAAYSSSENHLAKVLRQLSRTPLVKVVRGPRGGFMLAKPLHKITLLQVYEAVEGKYNPVSCFTDNHKCPRSACILGGQIEKITLQVRDYLAATTLASLLEETKEDSGETQG